MAHPKPCQLIEYDGAKEIHHGNFPSHKMALLHTRNNDIKSYLIVSPANGKGITNGRSPTNGTSQNGYSEAHDNGPPKHKDTISMKIQLVKGKTKSCLTKTFVDERHKNNYIALMQRKGFKVEAFPDAETEAEGRNHTRSIGA